VGAAVRELGKQVADAPPKHPEPLDQDGCSNLFSAETTGAGVVLEPASMADMCGGEVHEKPSLEVFTTTFEDIDQETAMNKPANIQPSKATKCAMTTPPTCRC
jgi:hypothetical protein